VNSATEEGPEGWGGGLVVKSKFNEAQSSLLFLSKRELYTKNDLYQQPVSGCHRWLAAAY
jgi:hypothetical protein